MKAKIFILIYIFIGTSSFSSEFSINENEGDEQDPCSDDEHLIVRQLILNAAELGNLSLLKTLLPVFPFFVDIRSACGSTPLFHAAEGNHARCVEYLIDMNASNETNFDGKKYGAIGITALHGAVEWGSHECLSLLIVRFPKDINRKSPQGAAPLFWASEDGNIDCVRILLENHADPDIPFIDSEGSWAALEGALQTGNHEVARLIEDHLLRRTTKNNSSKKRKREAKNHAASKHLRLTLLPNTLNSTTLLTEPVLTPTTNAEPRLTPDH